MLNRFANCKTLKDLYTRFNDDTREYSKVSVVELESIAEVFKANVEEREMPDVPLTDKGYTYIWNYVVDTVESGLEEKEDVTMLNDTTKTNGTVNLGGVEGAVADLMNRFAQAKEGIKCEAGETYEEFIDKTDESLNTMKDALGSTIGVLDTVLGYTLLKDAILDMMDASLTNGGKKDLFRMARKCRELIEAEIKNLEFWGDEKSLKKAVQLKALTEGVRGKSIFEAFASGCIWIVKKVVRKISSIFPDVDGMKDGLFKSICKGVRSLAIVLKAGLHLVWSVTKFAASFVVAGVVIAVDWLVRTVKTFIEKIKGWAIHKKEEIQNAEPDDENIEDEIISEGDGVFGTNLA